MGVSPITQVLESLSKHRVGLLSGNGIKLPSFLAVFTFFLSRSMRCEDVVKLTREVPLGRKGASAFLFEEMDESDIE